MYLYFVLDVSVSYARDTVGDLGKSQSYKGFRAIASSGPLTGPRSSARMGARRQIPPVTPMPYPVFTRGLDAWGMDMHSGVCVCT